MPRERIDEINSTFDAVYQWILGQNVVRNLVSTGGTAFDVYASQARDGRRFLELPHANRVYEGDWGYRYNSMGTDGQRIGQYCLPIHEAYLNR
jgi:hypothetical protein